MSILNPLFEAVAWVISRIHDVLSVPFGAGSGWSWGLSIVLLVCLMRLIMVPLFVKQVKSQRKMQAHMPALQEIRKKYKNDKTRLNEETMKFYKENGINPLGGCLPLVAQLPVFWSLFNVLKAIADWTPGHTPQYGLSVATVTSARQAHVFGVLLSDKFLWATTGESWTVRAVILVSVAVSATTTFLTMRQSSKRGMMNQQMPDPDQPGAAMAQSMSKNMMYIAPFFALTGLYWQYGLVIYWVTTNVWTLGQQHILFRNLPIVGSANTAPRPRRRRPAGSFGPGRRQEQPGGGRRQEQPAGQDGDQVLHGHQVRHRGQAGHGGAKGRRNPATAKVPASKAPRGDQCGQGPGRDGGGQAGSNARRLNRPPTAPRTAVWSALRRRGTAGGGCWGSARKAGPGGGARGSRDQGRPAAAKPAGAQQAFWRLW